jgi:hypothetical protein
MALGAVLAALNTMYATVSVRSSEIATMRALGFSGGHVVFSFVLGIPVHRLYRGPPGVFHHTPFEWNYKFDFQLGLFLSDYLYISGDARSDDQKCAICPCHGIFRGAVSCLKGS